MVEVKKIDSANALIKAKLENLDEIKRKVAKDLAKKVKLPGFRPGKIPIKVIESRFAEDIEREAISKAIKEVLDEGLKKLGIEELIGDPDVVKYDPETKEVEIKVYTKPNVNIDDNYKDCVPEAELPEISEEEIEEELKKIAQAEATTKVSQKETLEKGDIAVINFKGFIDGKPMENGSAEDYPLEIGSNQFVPGFEDQLIGMRVGEKRKIKVTFPNDYHAKEIAGKEAEFEVELQEIQEKVPAEINDELAKKYLNKEDATLQDLKDYIKNSLMQRKKVEVYAPLREKILECLVEKYDLDLPENIVEREIDVIVNEEASKLTPAQLKEIQEDVEKYKEFREKFRNEAKDRVKLTFIIDELAKKENIDVTDEELTQIIFYEALMQGQNPQELIKYYKENNLLPVVKMNIIQEKLLTKLLDEKAKH
jgi:trigger factor